MGVVGKEILSWVNDGLIILKPRYARAACLERAESTKMELGNIAVTQKDPVIIEIAREVAVRRPRQLTWLGW
jgi:hypothetical protein